MKNENKQQGNLLDFLLDIDPLLNKVKNKTKKLTETERLKSAPWKLKLNFYDKSVTFHKTKEKLITYYDNLEMSGSADIYKGYLNKCGMLRYKHHSYFKEGNKNEN